MTAPVLFGQAKWQGPATNQTSHSVTLLTHAIGDRLWVEFNAAGSSTHTAVESGWDQVQSPGTTGRQSIFTKIAASTSETLTVTTSSATQATALIKRITASSGYTVSYQIDTAGFASGYGNNTYFGGFSPTAGTQDYLTVTTVGSNGTTVYPSIAYGGTNLYTQAAAGSGGCSSGSMNDTVTTNSISDASFDSNPSAVDWRGYQAVFWEEASGGGGITGTLAVTESGPDTIASSGTVRVQGSLAVSEAGADTSAIAGTVRVSGSLAVAESGSDTAAIVGGSVATGSLNATETGSDTAAVAGTVLVAGSLATSESGSDTAALAGVVLVQGALSAFESGSDTAVVAGVVVVQGALSVTESGSDTFAAVGTLGGGVVGSLNATESGSDTLAASGVVVVAGGLSAVESGSDSAAVSGSVPVQGALAVTEDGPDTFSAQGVATAITGLLNAQESGSDTAEILGDGVDPSGERLGGFVITDTAPRLWWQRKPKVLAEEEAEKKVARVVRVVERIALKQVEAEQRPSAKEQKREVREAIAPLVAEMPGFDWMAIYRTILIELGRRQQEQQAAELAQIEVARIQAIRRDEDDMLLLLMSVN